MIYDDTDPVNQEALDAVRARLLEQIAALSAPAPAAKPLTHTEARWQRRARLAAAQRVLRAVNGNLGVATAIGVTGRAVAYWRAGTHSPTSKHWRQLGALHCLLTVAGARIEPRITIIDRGRQQDAAD